MKKNLTTAALATLCICSFSESALCGNRFFTPPETPYVVSVNETVRVVDLPGLQALRPTSWLEKITGAKPQVSGIEEAQKLIDAARAESPEAVLLIESKGLLEVGANPLRLSSRMCLRLQPSGIRAAENSAASSLIEIVDAELVSVVSAGPGPAVLDGGKKSLTGITVRGGARMNFDHLVVSNCGKAGIEYLGRDAAAVNEASSATRCHFLNNGDGLKVETSAAFQCLDNEFQGQTGTALVINSLTSVVAGNTFKGNQAGIQSGSDRGVIARNSLGDTKALDLTPTSVGNLVTENTGAVEGLQITIAGSTQQFFRNALTGSASLATGSTDIFLIGNTGLQTDAAHPGLKLFNPPTFRHPHANPLIVEGMGRFDLPPIVGGKAKRGDEAEVPAVDLSVVQAAIDQARAEHPNDVLVVKLVGEFVSRTLAGLQLLPNTCLILEGRILADLGLPLDPPWVRGEPVGQLIMLPKTGYSSISGGKLDAARQANHPINAYTGSVSVIESVNITAGSRDGINTKARSKGDPLFIYRCNVYGNNARGIWSHVATRVHAIANNCVANNTDGIDLDAHAIDCTALFNTCTGNRRHGVFIEEGVDHNIVFGNTLNENLNAGVHTWNEEVKQNSGPNVISANECNGNRRGVSVGGRAADKTANDNLFFNNVCRGNWQDGLLTGNSHGKKNYFSQCVVGQNVVKDIVNPDSGEAVFFNSVIPAKK